MKWLFIITLTCNQAIYDQIYGAILDRAISSKLNQRDIDSKNEAIEKLRALCRGQLSSLEKGDAIEKVN
jgi:hypothetical protein